MTLEDELLDIIEQMKTRSRVVFEAGLTDAEINSIESLCNFQFPPDLRIFLQLAMPVARKDRNGTVWFHDRFPNWRKDPVGIMRENTRIWQTDFCHAFSSLNRNYITTQLSTNLVIFGL